MSNTEEPAAVGGDSGQTSDAQPEQTLSKSQLKKLKRKEKWQEVKAQKRKAEKDRYKARKKACRERGEDMGPTRKQLKHNRMTMSSCKLRVVIDCDFDDYMADKDIKMLVKQIQFSYSANRRAENPLQFYCCGVGGKTRERLETLGDYKGWDIRFRRESYSEMFDKSSIVYLSSESPNILESLDDSKVYIIGGLVDHNHHKGLCHRLAEEKGFAHAQLPISDHIDMKTRKVLTINHVFEILLHYTETQDWQKAIYTVLPPRKGAVPKQPGHAEKTENLECSDKSNGESQDDTSHSSSHNADTTKRDDVKKPCCQAKNNNSKVGGSEKESDVDSCNKVDKDNVNGDNVGNDSNKNKEKSEDNTETTGSPGAKTECKVTTVPEKVKAELDGEACVDSEKKSSGSEDKHKNETL